MGSITAGYNGRRIFSASSLLRALAINRLFLHFRASIWRKISRRPAAGLFRQLVVAGACNKPMIPALPRLDLTKNLSASGRRIFSTSAS